MSKTVGRLVIDLTAGTVNFDEPIDRSSAKLRNFGNEAERERARLRVLGSQAEQAGRSFQHLGSHSVTGVQATSAALRTLEGGVTNNLRAAERFAANFLGLGPILQKVFPIAGGIAFLGILGELVGKASELYDAFRKLQDAPNLMKQAFTDLNRPLAVVNDQLRVTNDRLEADIAKLQGKAVSNGLVTALDEARVYADKLGDSLNKDLSALEKLLKEQQVSKWAQVLGIAGTADIAEQIQQFHREINDVTEKGAAQIPLASSKPGLLGIHIKADPDAANKANAATFEEVRQRYGEQILKLQKQLNEVGETASPLDLTGTGAGSGLADVEARAQALRGAIANLRSEFERISEEYRNTGLVQTKERLETANAAEDLTRPYVDKMHELDAQLAGLKANLAAIGKTETAQTLAKSWAASQEAIAKLNNELAKHHQALTLDQQVTLLAEEDEIAFANAEKEWRTKFEQSTAAIGNRIAALKLLTDAIGKGAAAQRQATVESQVMQTLGPKYNDPQWMASHDGDVKALRAQFGAEYDAGQAKQAAENVDKLSDQIELEKSLAAVQTQGAEAVRLVTLAYRLRNLTMAGATREQIQAEIDLYNATKANQSASNVANINQEIDATERLNAAQIEGAEAYRRAQLEVKYEQMAKNGASPQEIDRTRALDEAKHQGDVVDAAMKTGLAYQNQLESINQEIAALEKLKATQGDTLAIEISLKELEQERVRILSAQHDVIGSAADGMKDFFREMATESESAAKQIHDDFKSAFDGINDELSKLMSGQKANWASFLQSFGQKLAKQGLEDLEHQAAARIGGLGGGRRPMDEKFPGVAGPSYGGGGVLGKIAGILLPGQKRDGSSATQALFVTLTNPSTAGNSFPPQPSPKSPAKTAGLSNDDKANLGNFANDELKQLAKPDEQTQSGWMKTLQNGAVHLPGVGAQIGSAAVGLLQAYLTHKGKSGGSSSGSVQSASSGSVQSADNYDYGNYDDYANDVGSGGAYASGGRPPVGKMSLVGEHGPELFIPDRPGAIIPNHKLRGHRAMGGPVDPGNAYLVGERGPEAFSMLAPEAADSVNDRQVVQYSIDARGATDPELTRQNVERAIKAAHSSAIVRSTQIQSEKQRRTPHK